MKRMTGEPWSLFVAVALAACQVLVGCASEEKTALESDLIGHEARLTRVQSKAQEAPMEDEEEERAMMALDEGKMGRSDSRRASGQFAMRNNGVAPSLAKARATDHARSAGLLGALKNNAGGAFRTNGSGYGYSGLSSMSDFEAGPGNSEKYTDYGRNPMVATAKDRLSTFAVDVDTAAYAIARRKIRSGVELPPSAVRVEEFVNYFRYEYLGPEKTSMPFAVHMDAAPSPFSEDRHVLRIGVQAKKLSLRERKPVNLVFLVDVSGSMSSPDKLGLAKRALRILTNNLRDGDTVAMVTYAGQTEVVLEPTSLDRRGRILSAIADLGAGGSTAMGSGIQLAYELAARNLGPDVESRVIVLSDGDANVGKTSHSDILATIKGHIKEGVTLSTVGFGMGNYKDDLMEQLANKGNGNYYYIDGISQARRVFQEQLGGTLEVVAKDVKIQVDFDPEQVARYRLIGYENRDIADDDFRDDRVDAGEIGAGHTVTAMYEIELTEKAASAPALVRIRAKKPRGEKAREWAYAFDMSAMHAGFENASPDFRFATAVMAAAEILRGSEHAGSWRMAQVIDIAKAAAGERRERLEFIELMSKLRSATADAESPDSSASSSGERVALGSTRSSRRAMWR